MQDGSRIQAKHYICAVPPRELFDLLPASVRNEEPYISSHLWFDRKLGDEKFWAFIHDEAHLNSDFYNLSNIRHDWHDRPSVIASYIIYSHGAHSFIGARCKQYRDVMQQCRVHPRPCLETGPSIAARVPPSLRWRETVETHSI